MFRRTKQDHGGEPHSARRWTAVGPSGGPSVAVDPAGLVTAASGRFSIDWLVGADDRWRLPAVEASVRQSLVAGAPAVETAMRVPSGDAVHTCWAVPGAVVIEVENRSPSPFALALVVRPFGSHGAGRVDSIAVEGERVVVDGEVALVLPNRPGRAATSTGAGGDVASTVMSGGASESAAPVRCADGSASAAVIVPVAHRAKVRVVMPLTGGGVPAARDVADVEAVVKGWAAQDRVGVVVDVPDVRLADALAAARRTLLVVNRDEPGAADDAAIVVAALGAYGRHAEADEIIRSLWARERTDGSFDEPDGYAGAPGGAHLWALADGWRRRPDAELVRGLEDAIGRAVAWITELMATGRLSAPEAAWAALGASHAGTMAGEAGLALLASRLFALSVDDSIQKVVRPPEVVLLAEVDTTVHGADVPAAHGERGLDVVATAAALRADAARGDASAWTRLAWLLDAGASTWSWPRWLHPATGEVCSGPGHSPAAAAAVMLACRSLLMTELAPGHASIHPVPHPTWAGQGVEVHDLPLLGGGTLSYAVRWHGARPALLWEVRGGGGGLKIDAPGYDRAFVSVEPSGEVLLA